MLTCALFAFAFAIAVPVRAADTPAFSLRDPEVDTRVLGGNTLRIVYRPSSLRFDTVIVGGKAYLRIDFAQAVRPFPITQAGTPDLPWRHIPLAFPTRGTNVVRVIAADYEELRGVSVLPVPSLETRDGSLEPAGYVERRDLPRGLSPDPIALLAGPSRGAQCVDREFACLAGAVRSRCTHVAQILPDRPRSAIRRGSAGSRTER